MESRGYPKTENRTEWAAEVKRHCSRRCTDRALPDGHQDRVLERLEAWSDCEVLDGRQPPTWSLDVTLRALSLLRKCKAAGGHSTNVVEMYKSLPIRVIYMILHNFVERCLGWRWVNFLAGFI